MILVKIVTFDYIAARFGEVPSSLVGLPDFKSGVGL